MRVRLTSFAKAELFRVHGYHAAKSPGLGEAFLADGQSTLRLIKQYSRAWPRFGDTTRRCRLSRFRYGIVYREDDSDIVFVIAHMGESRPFGKNLTK